MLLYRITKCMYAGDLSGTGARLYGGRWNSPGQAMVYTASSRSLAVLEALVHLQPTNMPDDFCLAVIKAPDDVEETDAATLPANWHEYPEHYILQQTGNRFLQKQKHLLLKVPSAIVKEEFNYLINPAHPEALKVKVMSRQPFAFDTRLV